MLHMVRKACLIKLFLQVDTEKKKKPCEQVCMEPWVELPRMLHLNYEGYRYVSYCVRYCQAATYNQSRSSQGYLLFSKSSIYSACKSRSQATWSDSTSCPPWGWTSQIIISTLIDSFSNAIAWIMLWHTATLHWRIKMVVKFSSKVTCI